MAKSAVGMTCCKIDLGDDWRSKAMKRNEWKCIVREGVEFVNKSKDTREKKQKDERKHRQEWGVGMGAMP